MSEYAKMVERKFLPYSDGHQKMYIVPLDLISGTDKHSILDVGCGIGFGLSEMIKRDCFYEYVGLEPDFESYLWTTDHVKNSANITVLNQSLSDYSNVVEANFEYVFCIEVIEHIDPREVHAFIQQLLGLTKKNLFLSTPDIQDNKHGVRTSSEWRDLLSKYFAVTFVRSQWTTLFICQPSF